MNEIILLTGLSGAGKTTTLSAPMFEDYIKIELDNFYRCALFADLEEMKKEAGQVFYDYFIQHPELYKKLRNEDIEMYQFWDAEKDFLSYVLKCCEEDKENNYILEGTAIYRCLEIDYNKNYKYIILKLPFWACMLRRIKRNLNQGKTLKEIKVFYLFRCYLYEKGLFKQFLKALNRPLNIRYVYY